MSEHDPNTRPLWTEAELDAALADLGRQHAATAPPPLDRARARLLAALPPVPPSVARRSRRRWLTSAAAVVVLLATVLVVTNIGSGETHTANAAELVLQRAAGATIHQRDTPLRPGQYRYVTEHALTTAQTYDGTTHTAYRFGMRTQTWVPYDQTREWVQDNEKTGVQEVLLGSEKQARSDFATSDPGPPNGRITALCGDFDAVHTHRQPSCDAATNLKQPTSAWLATLPHDPRKLLAYLVQDIPGPSALQSTMAMQHAWMLLRSGIVPADLRAAIYQALGLLPDIQVTESSTNLDGRTGVALGVADQQTGVRRDIIVDPATGEYIGDRMVQIKDSPAGLPAGTLLDSTSTTTVVVDSVGGPPPSR